MVFWGIIAAAVGAGVGAVTGTVTGEGAVSGAMSGANFGFNAFRAVGYLLDGKPLNAGWAMMGISEKKINETDEYYAKGDSDPYDNPMYQGLYGPSGGSPLISGEWWNELAWGKGSDEDRQERVSKFGYDLLGTAVTVGGLYGLSHMSGSSTMLPFYMGRAFEKLGQDDQNVIVVNDGKVSDVENDKHYFWDIDEVFGKTGAPGRMSWDIPDQEVKYGYMIDYEESVMMNDPDISSNIDDDDEDKED
jgi:hypothetical protein